MRTQKKMLPENRYSHSKKPLVAVTGANGYIGSRVCSALQSAGIAIRPIVRSHGLNLFDNTVESVVVGDLANAPVWNEAIRGVDQIIHTAGMAHKVETNSEESAAEYFRINRDATLSLASEAIKQDVKKFLFFSSIAVYGPIENDEQAVESMLCKPIGHYANSKFAAERGLLDMDSESPMELAILRPPMVHGPDCPGNLVRLAKLLKYDLPLPFGALKSRRNLIGIDNLCDFVVKLINDERNISGIWNVADREDVDLPDILNSLGLGMGKHPKLISVPAASLNVLATLLGQRKAIEKLTSSMLVNSLAAQKRFGWVAPVTARDGLRKAGQSFAVNARVER